jgi:formylglycine-generating enzyme required for sulfatase activity
MLRAEDLVHLADTLRGKGFRPSTHQLLTARRLLLALEEQNAPRVSRHDLARYLGPIFCSKPGELEQFRVAFQEWVTDRFDESPQYRDDAPQRIVVKPEEETEVPPPTWWARLVACRVGFVAALRSLPGRAGGWRGVARWAAASVLFVAGLLAAWVGWQHYGVERTLTVTVTLNGQAHSGAEVKVGGDTQLTSGGSQAQFQVKAADLPLPLAVALAPGQKAVTAPDRVAGGEVAAGWKSLHVDTPSDFAETVALKKPPGGDVCPPACGDVPPPPSSKVPILTEEQRFVLEPPEPTGRQRIVDDNALLLALPVGVLLLWGLLRALQWWWRRNPALRRVAAETPDSVREVPLPGGVRDLADLPPRRFAHEMRRRFLVASHELQVEPTVHASAQRGGLFTPAHGSLVEPDYLILIDRSCTGDHLARFADAVVVELGRCEVKLECFDFDRSPAICRYLGDQHDLRRKPQAVLLQEAAERPARTLDDMRRRYADHRLLLISDGGGAFDPASGALRTWVNTLLEWAAPVAEVAGSTWPAPVLLTPLPVERWGSREYTLQKRGLLVLPFDRAGFAALGERLGGSSCDADPIAADDRRASHEHSTDRWLDISRPAGERVDRLLADLKQDLGQDGLDWLCACAAYPEIHWGLTLRLGYVLLPDQPPAASGAGESAGSATPADRREQLLTRLSRLVWLREAYMPDWLREALLGVLPRHREVQVRDALLTILEHIAKADPGSELPLRIATDRARRRRLWQRLLDWLRLRWLLATAPDGSPLRDHVFLEFLSGQQRQRTDFDVSRSFGDWLAGGLRRWWADFLVVGGAVAAATWLVYVHPPWNAGAPGVEILDLRVGVAAGGETAAVAALVVGVLGPDGQRRAFALGIERWAAASSSEWVRTKATSPPVNAWLPAAAGSGSLASTASEAAWALADGVGTQLWSFSDVHERFGGFTFPGSPLLSANGKTLAILGKGEFLVVATNGSTPSGSDVPTWPEPSLQLSALTLSPDGRWLATGWVDGQVWLWDVAQGRYAGQFAGVQQKRISALAFSADGRLLAVGDDAGQIRQWDTTTRQPVGAAWPASDSPVISLAWSPDGRRIASTDALFVSVRDAEKNAWVGQALRADAGQAFVPEALRASAGDGPTRLAIGVAGEIIVTRDNGKTWQALEARGESRLRAVDREGDLVVAVGDGGRIIISSNGGRTWIGIDSPSPTKLNAVAHSEAQWVAVGDYGTILVSGSTIDWHSLDAVSARNLRAVAWGSGLFVVVGDGGEILSSADGSVWTTRKSGTAQNLRFVAHDGSRWLALAADGTALSSADATVWKSEPGLVTQVAGFSPDGLHLVVFDRDGRVRVLGVPKLPPPELPPQAEVPATRSAKPGAAQGVREAVPLPKMVTIPAGRFLMGSLGRERTSQSPNEGPQHEVQVASFALGKYEVTFDEYDACTRDDACRRVDDHRGRGRRPVINVSWNDAQAYLRWLSKKTGDAYRLPSEAEWEYAARAGSSTRYPWGDDVGKGNANCYDCGSRWDVAAPVGSFAPNRFGLHDMAGNVWEWVEDCLNESYTGAPGLGQPAWTSGDCRMRMLRGGSWRSYAESDLRSASRDTTDPDYFLFDFGFRVARTLP